MIICVLDIGLAVEPGAILVLAKAKQLVVKGNLNWINNDL